VEDDHSCLNMSELKFSDTQPDNVDAPSSLKCAGFLTRHGRIDMARRTVLMGILNVTPDSFYDGGRRPDPARAVADGVALAEVGAEIVDVGGESTRPGARPVSDEEELERVLPVIRGLRKAVSTPISIDTYKAKVARSALDAGADIVNDISALRFDPEMAGLIARERVPVVLMHMQGTPRTMQMEPRYDDVVGEVREFLTAQVGRAAEAGIKLENIIIDPGIGFGKTLQHNLTLLRQLSSFTSLGQPLLVGASRKAFIGKILNLAPDDRLEGSLAVAVAAVMAGANIIRAHDIKETQRAIRVVDAIRYGANS
jgi:dihydropteroate synthase